MNILGLQPSEIRHKFDRLPAEGRLGNSENLNKPRRCFLLLPALALLVSCLLLYWQTIRILIMEIETAELTVLCQLEVARWGIP
jgi:hypothetical protein